jgi:hypothetical protein
MVAGYVLCRMAIGSSLQIPITEQHYNDLVSAVQTLMQLCEVEEKYAALVDNYFELEVSFLQEALRAMVFSDQSDVEVQSPKHLASRRLINLLTSARLFLDSLPHHAALLLTDEALENAIKAPSVAYDSSLGYRVMEALRNYSRHQSLPIHSWTIHTEWKRDVEPNQLEFSVEPALDLETLSTSRFKKSVLGELQASPSALKLKPHIREYVEQLSAVQEIFRDATAIARDKCIKQLAKARLTCYAKFPGRGVGLAALPIDDRGLQAGEPVYLGAPITNYLTYLQRKTNQLVKYSQRRVVY